MHRRRLLRSLGSGMTVGVAGCLGRASTDRGGTTPFRATRTDGTARAAEVDGAVRGTGTDSDRSASGRRARTPAVCSKSIRYDTQIVAIVDPAFGPDWGDVAADSRYATAGNDALSPETTVVGVGTDTHARAYPITVLTRHEIVNDTIGGTPLAVTYCPLCRSGLVFERVVDGVRTTFAVSGLLWSPSSDGSLDGSTVAFGAERVGGERGAVEADENLVMYDEATRSYWSQLLGRAICGPLAGTDLRVLPSTVTTWEQWRAENPDGRVLLPPPASSTVRSQQAGDGTGR
ncbi:DUF3179 domain-containing (seleno)protein [Salinigranum salinum]|uniref:DUF3179 domain-containing (seleno)protein n=1 Tax=Salinigranum salinum TaxID=1364937 RepID=UPI001F0336B5|nr:DUF3179 domain-containing (seleno)protein [Salinigranum salinum]